MPVPITLYGLMSCAHCKATRAFLEERGVPFDCIYVDLLLGDERSDTLRELRRINPEVSFPTVVIGDRVIVGSKNEQIEKALLEAGF